MGARDPGDSAPVPMTNTHDDTDLRDGEAPDNESGQSGVQYASLDLENGDVVIYDPDNHRAWIQSNVTVDAAATL